ncbi:MAG: alpha/beta fold hydrolase [SAR324 cluster bacterium]|nr:alpha/beta fold hydrolase [SAR324 cluster bacterium]
MSNLLPCVEVNPSKNPVASVVWLHGLGADGHDFEAVVPMLKIPDSLPIRFVFPHAPERPVTLNAGFVMRAWYDIVDLNFPRTVNLEELEISVQQTVALVEREMENGLPSEKIILAGFSQGGAIALHASLRLPYKLAGILALSTYMVNSETLAAERNLINQDTSIFMAHGTKDPVVPVAHGRQAYNDLQSFGYPISWTEYPMEHMVCLEEIQDVSAWMSDTL